MSYKTRSNYALGQRLSQERWDEIFGRKSNCHNASVKIHMSPDFIGDKEQTIGTCYYICTECGKGCDLK